MEKKVPIAVSVGLCLLAAACSTQPSVDGSKPTYEDVGLFQVNAQAVSTTAGFVEALETEEHRPYIISSQDMVRPDDPLTRAEAAAMLYSLLKEKPEPSSKTVYSDIPQGAWYREMAEGLGSLGMLELYGPLFAGESPLTRAEFTTLLMQFFEKAEGGFHFADVPKDYWAYEEITAGSALGWFAGEDGSDFRPEDSISRGEAVVVLNRALGRSPDKKAIDEKNTFLMYIDLPAGHWAYYDIIEASMPHQYEQQDEGGEQWQMSYLPEAQREPGYYLIDGELYCVQENHLYARNTQIGLLEFDNNGRYTTGDLELDKQLTELVRSKTVPEWEPRYNLQVLYRYICDSFEYWPDEMIEAGEEDWEARLAKRILENGRSNCYGYAGLLTVLARKLGYQARGVSGEFRNDFQEWTTHGWVELDIEGETFLCDPEIEGVYAPNRDLDWDLFMKQYGDTPTIYSVEMERFDDE